MDKRARTVDGMLIAITMSVGVAYADLSPRRASLVALDSGACLAGPGQPRVEPCDRAPGIALDRLGADGKVMLRDEARGQCLFSNSDGRFGWYQCTPAYGDQHWVLAPVGGAVMVRAVHSSACLFSNRDGRFGLAACDERMADQRWRAREAVAPAVEALTLAGDWQWSDGSATACRPDGTLLLPNDGAGVWRQVGPRRFEVSFNGGVAAVELSMDGNTLRGSFAAAAGARSPVSARRMGAEVRAEVRGGGDRGPLDDESFAGILASARATASEVTRRNLVIAALERSALTGAQLVGLLETFRSELNVLDVVRAVAPRVIDSQRALGYAARMRSKVNRERYVKLLTPSRPQPQPQPQPQPEWEPFDMPGAILRKPSHEEEPKRAKCPRPIPCGIYCRWGYAKDENGCGQCACLPNPIDLRR